MKTIKKNSVMYKFLCVAIIPILTIWNCSSLTITTKTPIQVSVSVQNVTDTLNKSDTALPTYNNFINIDSVKAYEYLHTINQIISSAESICKDSLFDSAHIIVKRSLPYFDSCILYLTDEVLDSLEIFEKMAALYVKHLPGHFLDSAPQILNSSIFQHQFSMISESLTVDRDDSLAIIGLTCDSGKAYNIPIVRNNRVNSSLLRILTFRKKTLSNLLKKANFYLPVMQAIIADSGIPTDIVYLPILESAFNPKAYSYAHASGIWQFIPSTGRIFGLRQNYWIDERRDPLKSTGAAAAYLKKLYSNLGDWYLALAAYNAGERRVTNAIKKANSRNYWDLKLPKQTMHYVPHFMAYQMLAKNPHCFGYEDNRNDTDCFDYETVIISDCIDLNKIAKGIGIKYDTLKSINPHLLRWCTPPNIDSITLYLPQNYKDTFNFFYKTLKDKDKVKWYRYAIKCGDNLGSIADHFSLSIAALKSINNLSTSRIIAGKYLNIPIPINHNYPLTSSSIDDGKNIRSQKLISFKKRGIEPTKYRLKSGETISEIAELFNLSAQDICSWNNIKDSRKIRAGTILELYTKLPTQTSKKKVRQVLVPKNILPSYYCVRQGDNLYTIAYKISIRVEHLAAWNKKTLSNPIIHPGERLLYYAKSKKDIKKRKVLTNGSMSAYIVQKNDNLYFIADIFSVDIEILMDDNNLTKSSQIYPGDTLYIPIKKKAAKRVNIDRIVYYTVRTGDNVWSIANKFSISVENIFRSNNISCNSVLKPGKKLKIHIGEES